MALVIERIDSWAFNGSRYARPARLRLATPFGRGSGPRVLVLYQDGRISISQVYPFVSERRALQRVFGADIRLLPNTALESGLPSGLRSADIIVLQSWLTDPPERLDRMLDACAAHCPSARIVYFDTFANCDLRLARQLEDRIAAYGKKAFFRDRSIHRRATHGHSALMEYYGDLYGIDMPLEDWQVSEEFLETLHLTPGFFTAPQLLSAFRSGPPPDLARDRPIDIHARLETQGTPWYQAMREDAAKRISALGGLRCATGTGLPWRAFMDEMRASKLCFSPFGYGELCWRDIEAFVTGSVLVKPDMGHLETRPEIFANNETYVSVAWDFSDLEAVVRDLLADPERRARIAMTAFERVRDYLAGDRMARDLGFVFEAN